ncbi:lipoprotein [Spiroplasma endosymbiont of Panorpa germanica]|uniref:lipoprotein n=1 Tax=Spiroplasma endosymbiont of Panorpa germanica TaxID=3066314 RepID=UPI0030D2598C
MKKLLSILGVATITVSTPMSVVACQKKLREIDDEYDYEQNKNQMIDIIREIFQKNIAEDFSKFIFISEEDSPIEGWSVEKFNSIEGVVKNDSEEFKDLNTQIRAIINWDKILSEVNSQVVQNINYKSMIYNNQNPLQGGYQISKIEIFPKPENNAVTISVEIDSSILYKNQSEQQEFEPIKSTAKMTIFEEKKTAEILKEANNKYADAINNEENSNNFIFKSDKGNIKETALAIDEDLSLRQKANEIIKEAVESVEGITSLGSATLDTSSKSSAIISSYQYPQINWTWGKGGGPLETVRQALMGNQDKIDELLDGLVESNPSFFYNGGFRISEIPGLEEGLKVYPDMSRDLNPFILDRHFNYEKNFKSTLEYQQSHFLLDMDKDQNTIALLKTSVKNSKVEYNGENFELSNMTIAVRQQLKTFENTKELARNFYLDSLNFAQKFYNINEKTEEQNPELTFFLNKPESWNEFEPLQVLSGYDYFQDLLDANPESEEIRQKLNLTVQMRTGFSSTRISKTVFNEEGYVYFYDKVLESFSPDIYFLFFSHSYGNEQEGMGINFGYRYDIAKKQNLENPNPWKFI